MPRFAQLFSDIQIKNLKLPFPKKKAVGDGLYIAAKKIGGKYWLYRYKQLNGKENTLSFGDYPEVSLQLYFNSMPSHLRLIPTIVFGGAGSRLWPISRELHPKPFIRFADAQSLLQKAYLRGAQLHESFRGNIGAKP